MRLERKMRTCLHFGLGKALPQTRSTAAQCSSSSGSADSPATTDQLTPSPLVITPDVALSSASAQPIQAVASLESTNVRSAGKRYSCRDVLVFACRQTP